MQARWSVFGSVVVLASRATAVDLVPSNGVEIASATIASLALVVLVVALILFLVGTRYQYYLKVESEPARRAAASSQLRAQWKHIV